MPTKLSKRIYCLLALCLPFLLASCWEKENPSPRKDVTLLGAWVLQYIEISQADGSTQRLEGQNIQLTFTNASTYQQDNEPGVYDLHGTMPLNQYFGSYAVTGSPIVPTHNPLSLVLKVPSLGSTLRGGEPEMMQLEQLYLHALKEVSLANVYQTELVLTSRYRSARLVYGFKVIEPAL